MKTLLAAALALALGTCWAGLGDRAGAAPPGASVMPLATPGGATYTQIQRRLPSGTEVNEFVDAGGIVFAVSWDGPFLPDLRELLGRHFGVLTQHQAARGHASAVSLQRPDLVVVAAGRMGSFQGRAWLPPQLPAGFEPGRMP
jgi:hypothetical protein